MFEMNYIKDSTSFVFMKTFIGDSVCPEDSKIILKRENKAEDYFMETGSFCVSENHWLESAFWNDFKGVIINLIRKIPFDKKYFF